MTAVAALLLFLCGGVQAETLTETELADAPPFSGSSPVRFGILARARHTASHRRESETQHTRTEHQTILPGLYARGTLLPETRASFLYGIDASLAAVLENSEDDGQAAESAAGRDRPQQSSLDFEPGKSFYAGITLCDSGSCGWTAGRGMPEHPHAAVLNTITGSHGPRAGTSLFFHGEHVLLRLTPWFLPSQTGGGLADLSGTDSVEGPSGRGARMEAGAFFKYGGFAFHYEALSRSQTTRRDLQGREALELGGMGFVLRKEEGFFRFEFRAAAEHSSGRYAATTNDERGNPFARIDGSALRSGLILKAGPVQFGSEFFLPQPASTAKGRRNSKETSGYVAYGDAIGPAVLRSANMRAFPTLCHGRCEGLNRPEDQDHAGLLQAILGYEGELAEANLELRIFRPLLAEESSRSNPLRTTRRDREKTEYHEGAVAVHVKQGSGELSVRYARMRGRKNGDSFLAAESAEISILRFF